jgi:hypothetical protein
MRPSLARVWLGRQSEHNRKVLRTRYRASEDLPLVDLIQYASKARATDIKDRVFGSLGLARKSDRRDSGRV